jgi:hypothetical protein
MSSEIDHNSGAITTAVTEQARSTGEISRNANTAAGVSRQMAGNIAEVQDSVSFTASAAQQLFTASAELAKQSEALRGDFESFIASLGRAGERRIHDRIPIETSVRVTARGGKEVPGRMIDISRGGGAIRCEGAFGIAEEIQIEGLDQMHLVARVTEVKDGILHVLFRIDAATAARIDDVIDRYRDRVA